MRERVDDDDDVNLTIIPYVFLGDIRIFPRIDRCELSRSIRPTVSFSNPRIRPWRTIKN